MEFFFSGHPLITATHRSTIEITKEKRLTRNGDCIIGVGADFNPEDIKELLSFPYLEFSVEVSGIREKFAAQTNPSFCHSHEIVFRKSAFISERTLGIRCNKAAIDLNREIIEKLKNPSAIAKAIVIGKNEKKTEQ